MKTKIAFVLKRYGEEVSGGSEFYTKALAEHLAPFYDVEILTTTALDLMYFDPYYPVGETSINGVIVRRFPCARRNRDVLEPLSREVSERVAAGGANPPEQESTWAQINGPDAPSLFGYLEQHADEYAAVFAVCYIDYTTIQTIGLLADKTVLIPTAHDEIWIRLGIFRPVFHHPRYLGFLTQEEHDFIRSQFRNNHVPGEILGCGIEVPQTPQPDRFRRKFNIDGEYLAYVGRIDPSKGCDVLLETFIRYKNEHPSSLSLVLMGKSTMAIPDRPDIIQTGFIAEQEKFDGLAGALAHLAPSQYESLCIALLEGFAVGIPALANGQCKILHGHCQKSGAGFVYHNYASFKTALDFLLSEECDRRSLRENALSYISKNYSWDLVLKKIEKIVHDISLPPENKNFDQDSLTYSGRNVMYDRQNPQNIIMYDINTQLFPAYSRNEVAVCFSSSDYFAPIMSVALASVVKNTSRDYNYDILILITDMSYEHIHLLNEIVEGKPNITLRFINVQKAIDRYHLSLSNHYTKFTFYRLLIPQMMREFEKILYLDSDLVVNHDIAELYQTDLDGYLLASTRDLTVYCWMLMDENSVFRRYMDEYCGLRVPGSYMQGGVSLYNIKKFNAELPSEILMQKASERSYQNCDQDLMNILCFGKIKFVSQRWNMLVMHTGNITLYNTVLPQEMFEAYIDARNNPYIIHYSAQLLPCFMANVDKFQYFWKYARETPYYEILLAMVEKRPSQPQPSTSINLMAQFEGPRPSPTADKAGATRTGGPVSPDGSRRLSLFRRLFPKETMKDFRRRFFRIYARRHPDNHMDRLSRNEHVSLQNTYLILHPGGCLNGPGAFMRKGCRHVLVDIKLGSAFLEIKDGEQNRILKSLHLNPGKNYISYKLRRDTPSLEFTITNDSHDDTFIRRVYYC